MPWSLPRMFNIEIHTVNVKSKQCLIYGTAALWKKFWFSIEGKIFHSFRKNIKKYWKSINFCGWKSFRKINVDWKGQNLTSFAFTTTHIEKEKLVLCGIQGIEANFVKLDIFYSERLELWWRAFQCFVL